MSGWLKTEVKTEQEEFRKKFVELCERYNLVIMPSYDLKPSAHDPMLIVPLNEDRLEYLKSRIYIESELQ